VSQSTVIYYQWKWSKHGPRSRKSAQYIIWFVYYPFVRSLFPRHRVPNLMNVSLFSATKKDGGGGMASKTLTQPIRSF